MPAIAKTGADYVSVGALTHSAAAADLSFELEPEPPPSGAAQRKSSAAAPAKRDASSGPAARTDV